MGTLAILQLADVIGGCCLYLSIIYLSIYIYMAIENREDAFGSSRRRRTGMHASILL